MHWLHALLLGIVQGLTEFFPVSSSAHLNVVKRFLGISGETLLFDLFCHLGTLVVLLYYFRHDIKTLLIQPQQQLVPLLVALLPLIPFYFLLKPLQPFFSAYVGYCMLGTAAFLALAERFKFQSKTLCTVKDSLWIGTLQAIALIPGISRSAATITGGLWRGLGAKEAVRFSFLVSLPAIGGGTLLELYQARAHLFSLTSDLPACVLGFTTSAIIGALIIQTAIPILQKGTLKPFAWYCLIVATVLILYL
jgi:undecaprenyl-diphosphatase